MLKKTVLVFALGLPALASANPYLVAGGATGNVDLSDAEANYAFGHTTDDSFGRAILGAGADINQNLAVEALYMTEAKASITGTGLDAGRKDELSSDGFQFALLGKAPLTPQFSLFGKLSANYMKVKDDNTTGGLAQSDDDQGVQLGYGVGGRFQITDTAGVSLALERIELSNTLFGSKYDTNLDQASLTFQFGF